MHPLLGGQGSASFSTHAQVYWQEKEGAGHRIAAHRKEQVDAGHFIDDEGLKAKEEDREVVHPLQHGRHCRDVHQIAREEQTQQQHLAHHPTSLCQHQQLLHSIACSTFFSIV